METLNIEDEIEETQPTADKSAPPVMFELADAVSHRTLDDLKTAFSSGPRPEGSDEQNPNYYRRQRLIVRTDCHNATGEPEEETLPLFQIGFIAAFQRLISMEESEKSERMKALETLMWETIIQDWGFSKWHWRSKWYVVGFEPPGADD